MNERKIYKNSVLTTLLMGRKGGKTTIEILDELLIRPRNINQLAKILNKDYNTIRYHINMVFKCELVTKGDEGYGNLYYPSNKFIKSLNEYEEIKKCLLEK